MKFSAKGLTVILETFYIFILVLVVIGPVAALDDFWVNKTSMPVEVVGHGVAAVDGKIYVIGGSNYDVWVVNSTFQYDPTADCWTPKKSMPTARSNFGIAVYEGKIYCFGGDIGTDRPLPTAITEVYDPVTDSWESKASMPTARYDLVASAANGKIYLIGGFDYKGPYCLNITEVYDPKTDLWISKASMPTGVMSCASAVIDDKIYVLGGRVYTSTSGYDCNLTQIYYPFKDVWTYGVPLPEPVTYATAGATTGAFAPKRIYVLGGRQMLDSLNFTQIYNPETNNWIIGNSMPTARCRFGVAVVNDQLYAIGGLTGWFTSLSAVNEQYTPIGYQNPSGFPFWIILPLLIALIVMVFIILKRKWI